MDDQTALTTVDKIFQMVFDQPNRFNLDELFQKLVTGMRLPYPVQDAITGDTTWSIADKSQNFITQQNVSDLYQDKGWIKPFFLTRLINYKLNRINEALIKDEISLHIETN